MIDADVKTLKHLYRFRPARALLGPYDEDKGQFEELERQELYFAKPSELNDAMETQLLEQYLKDNDCQHGLYLVGWFNCDQWDPKDYRRKRAPNISIADAQRKRWAAAKGETAPAKAPAKPAKKGKRRLSPEGRAAIVAAAKKRWAAKNAA